MNGKLYDVSFGYSVEAKGQTPALFQQVHGTRIVDIDAPEVTPVEADGGYSYTSRPVHVFTADCFPVLLASREAKTPVMALHAGWRGLRDGIVAHGLKLFSDLSAVFVIVGPAIKVCCFEVREDFLSSFRKAGREPETYVKTRQGKTYFDLTRFLRETDLRELSDAQIHWEHHHCTHCTPGLPSFRRQGEANPRLRTWIRR